jgi:hypothetical protein
MERRLVMIFMIKGIRKMKGIFLLGMPIFLMLIASCKKDKETAIPVTKGVYIVNEGNFTFGNGEVSFYDPTGNAVSNNLFNAANGYALGDVAQSMYIKDSTGFIVLNNSQKVEVVRIPSFKKIRTITIANSSPRYFMPVNDSIAYVSELYAGKIYLINYQTGNLLKEIITPTDWTDRMIMNGENLIVEDIELSSSNTHNSGISVINTQTGTMVNSYKLNPANITGLVKDKYGRIWVAKTQDSIQHQSAVFYVLNNDFSVKDSVVFAWGHQPSNLSVNETGDRIYFLDNGIYSLSVEQGSSPGLLVNGGGHNFYGLGIDPTNDDIYVSDALDFVQPSRIYRYNKNGGQVYTFTAGIIAGNFVFNY